MPVPAGIPTDGLKFCFEAGQLGLADGSSVSQLTDQSVNLFHATQGTTARRGVYKAAGIGGKGAVLFDGVDDFYGLPTAALGMFQNVGGGTVVAVIQDQGPLDSTTSRRVFIATKNATLGTTRLGLRDRKSVV